MEFQEMFARKLELGVKQLSLQRKLTYMTVFHGYAIKLKSDK